MMHPGGGLGLAHLEVQAMPGLHWERQDFPLVTYARLAQALFQVPNRRTRIALVGNLYTSGNDLRQVDIGKISTEGLGDILQSLQLVYQQLFVAEQPDFWHMIGE